MSWFTPKSAPPTPTPTQGWHSLCLAQEFFSKAICAWRLPHTPPPPPPLPSWEPFTSSLDSTHLSSHRRNPVCRSSASLGSQNYNFLLNASVAQFCHPFFSACRSFRLLRQTGWIDMQEQNIDVPLVFTYNKTQSPLRWHKVQNKGSEPSRSRGAAVTAVSGRCFTNLRTKWFLKVNLLLDQEMFGSDVRQPKSELKTAKSGFFVKYNQAATNKTSVFSVKGEGAKKKGF